MLHNAQQEKQHIFGLEIIYKYMNSLHITIIRELNENV